MAGFIIWLVIIFIVLAVNKSNTRMKKPGGAQRMNPPSGSQGTASAAGSRKVSYPSGGGGAGQAQKGQDPWASNSYANEREKQQALKERLAKKYSRTASQNAGGDILSRAKASVEEDFSRTWDEEEKERQRKEQQERQAREQKEQQRRQARERQEQQRQQAREQKEQQERQARQQKEQQWQQVRGQGQQGRQGEPQSQGQQARRQGDLGRSGGTTERPSMDPMQIMGQEESFDLDAVWDLMVKGPDMELTFERDFIAEGIEMLNRIQA